MVAAISFLQQVCAPRPTRAPLYFAVGGVDTASLGFDTRPAWCPPLSPPPTKPELRAYVYRVLPCPRGAWTCPIEHKQPASAARIPRGHVHATRLAKPARSVRGLWLCVVQNKSTDDSCWSMFFGRGGCERKGRSCRRRRGEVGKEVHGWRKRYHHILSQGVQWRQRRPERRTVYVRWTRNRRPRATVGCTRGHARLGWQTRQSRH